MTLKNLQKLKERYRKELAESSFKDDLLLMVNGVKRGDIILVYSAKDKEHNQAIVLKEYLEEIIGFKSNH